MSLRMLFGTMVVFPALVGLSDWVDRPDASKLTIEVLPTTFGANQQTLGGSVSNNCDVANGGPSYCGGPNQGYPCIVCTFDVQGSIVYGSGKPLQNPQPNNCAGGASTGTCTSIGDPAVSCIGPKANNATCAGNVSTYTGQRALGQ